MTMRCDFRDSFNHEKFPTSRLIRELLEVHRELGILKPMTSLKVVYSYL